MVFDYNVGLRGYNLFTYCGNEPIFRLDPFGTSSIGAEEDADITNDTVSAKESGSLGGAHSGTSGTGIYHYGVNLTTGSNSSIYSGGTWGSGYTIYSYNSQPCNSPSIQTPDNPLENITYTRKVLEQMQLEDNHGFPLIVDNYGAYGELSIVQNKYGTDYYRLTIDGYYNGHDGYYEYIWNMSGICNHRFFVRR